MDVTGRKRVFLELEVDWSHSDGEGIEVFLSHQMLSDSIQFKAGNVEIANLILNNLERESLEGLPKQEAGNMTTLVTSVVEIRDSLQEIAGLIKR